MLTSYMHGVISESFIVIGVTFLEISKINSFAKLPTSYTIIGGCITYPFIMKPYRSDHKLLFTPTLHTM